jgi:hypothetical protein
MELASPGTLGWNQITEWLRQVEKLKNASAGAA